MVTKWRDAPLSEYQIHDTALAEGGYNYYLYIHATGDAIIMREKTDTTEYRYADGGKSASGWAGRGTATYVTYDLLA